MNIDWLNGNSIITSMGGIRIKNPFYLRVDEGGIHLCTNEMGNQIIFTYHVDVDPDTIHRDYKHAMQQRYGGKK